MTGKSLLLAGTVLVTATACTNVPELDDKISPQLENANFPKLVPLEDALGPPVSPRDEAQEIEDELNARAANLQNRAQQLQTPLPEDPPASEDTPQ